MVPLNIYKTVFDASPIGSYLLSPEFIILNVNQAFLRATSRKREQLVGFNLFDVFEANPEDKADTGIEALRSSLMRVLETHKADTLALQRYPIKIYPEIGEPYFVERYWSAVNTPICNEHDELVCIFHTTIDVTELVTIQKQLEAVVADDNALANAEAEVFPRVQAVQEINKALSEERDRLRHLFDRSPGFVYFTQGPDHIIEQVNEAFYELVGRRDLLGRSIRDTFPEIAPQGFFELHDQVYSTGKPYVNHGVPIWLRRTRDGPLEQRFMDLVYEPIHDREGMITGICAQGLDVTEVKRVQDELRRHDERWKMALEASGDGVWDWDLVADQIFYPIPWAKIVGLEERENHSFPAEEWKKLIHPEDLNHVMNKVVLHLTGREKTYSVEYRLRDKDGGWIWVLARGAVVGHDEKGKPTRMVGTITDITESKSTEQKIWYEANFDNLTDLPNRRLFRDRLEQEMRKAHRSGHCVALLFIDLDRFKEVNDLWGHDTGDLLLVEAARRIQNCVRSSDTVARLGGDEFTVILTDFNEKLHVEEISNKLLEALTTSFTLGEEEANISASIGITIYPPDATDAEALIRNADQAMYNAKKLGRNQFSFFTKAMQDEAYARLKLIGELREGLALHQFRVVYQPIIELATGRVTKAEALLRWDHPDMGDINPMKFIPLAEESGMINQLGDWVFRQAASASVELSKKYGPNFEISVNRSAMQFQSPGEFNWADHLKSLGLQKNSISVEITEGMLVDATPKVIETLLQYRDAGIQVAIDDFGTGYSSMAYLKEFDIDYLKIDQSFIKDIDTNPSSSAIARSIIAMAHELDLKVVAEGIETTEQQDVLLEAGCDFGQGFLFSQPLPLSTFISQLH